MRPFLNNWARISNKEVNLMTKQLIGKTAIVTGASSGIGTAIAKELAKLGANVVLAARNKAKLESISAEIGKGGKILPIQTDVTKQQDVDFLAERAKQVFGSVDIYVNNAGKMGSSRVLQGEVSDWDNGNLVLGALSIVLLVASFIVLIAIV